MQARTIVRIAAAIALSACGYNKPGRVVDGGPGSDGLDSDASDLDGDVDVDADESCACSGDMLVCPQQTTTCAATCVSSPEPHCMLLQPSNGVERDLLSGVSTKITITALTTIDSGTGAFSGGITRAAGQGVTANIGYTQVGLLGVFTFDELEINAGQTLRIAGSRPAVFLVRKAVRVNGIIDASADQGTTTQPGPGGGIGGGTGTGGNSAAGGCGPGGFGNSAGVSSDSGGGGGGGGSIGATGGVADQAPGGTAGGACIPLGLEPLTGGSGGGGGGKGDVTRAKGGGGGGALQISSLEAIIVSGTGIIDLGGAGGEPGLGDNTDPYNSGAGGGGGSGGALLLEAPAVTVMAGAVIAANGGGGGGAANNDKDGTIGQDGQRSATVATGGAASSAGGTKGGNGGAGSTSAQAGTSTNSAGINTGGGGGAVGRIFVRAHTTPALGGTISPAAGTGAFRGD